MSTHVSPVTFRFFNPKRARRRMRQYLRQLVVTSACVLVLTLFSACADYLQLGQPVHGEPYSGEGVQTS